MPQLAENISTSKIKELNIKNYSIQELIDKYMNDSYEYQNIYKAELIERGKNNIYNRIAVKKSCKNNIAHQESIVKEIESKTAANKELISYIRKRFLEAISLLDRIQIEWQRYDVHLKR